MPIADMCAGLYAVTAMRAPPKISRPNGPGSAERCLDVPDVQVSLLTHQAMAYYATGKDPEKHGTSHSNLAPYQAFKGSDGE